MTTEGPHGYRYVVLPVGGHINQFRAEASILGVGDKDVVELVTQIFDELQGGGIRPTPNKDMLIWRLDNDSPEDWTRLVNLFAELKMGIHSQLNELRLLPGQETRNFNYAFDQFRVGQDVLIKRLEE